MKLRTQALEGYDSNEYGLECKDPSLAQQNQKDDADINIIVKRMGVGIPPPMTARIPLSGEFLEITDYREAIELTMKAEKAFNQLPAKVRARFENDPGQFLDFMDDPENGAEMVALGLAVPRPQEAPEAPKEEPKPK